MDNKQQTAVEWLYNELLNAEPNVLEWNKLLEQAKEMEKEHKRIELPTDEEIKKESKYKSNYILPQAVQFNPILNIVWIEGAKWMRNKIQGGKQ